MPKKNRAATTPGTIQQILLAGKTVPENLVRRSMTDLRQRLETRFRENQSLRREAAKHLGTLRRPAGKRKSLPLNPATQSLRGIGERLANRKLVAPPLAREIGGIVAGSYSVKLTPPYAFAEVGTDTPPTGETASADRFAGVMSCGASTLDLAGNSFMLAQATLGVFFFPPFGPAVLRASATPSCSFAWLVENVQQDGWVGLPFSDGTFDFGIVGYLGARADQWADQLVFLWAKELDVDFGQFGIQFDVGSIPATPLATQLAVDTNHFYLIYLNCGCIVGAGGWDRTKSVAVGNLAVTLPSISLDLELIPVTEPLPQPAARHQRP